MDFPAPLSPTNPTRSPGLDAKCQIAVRGSASAGVGERDAVELHHRRERAVEVDRHRRRLDRRARVQHGEDVVRRGAAHHSVVQQRAQVTLWAEHLDPHHQHDQQHVEAHLALRHAPRAEGEHRGAPHRDAGVGESARERVGREHPHGGPEDFMRAFGQHAATRGALAEGLEGGEPLHRVEKFRREPAVRLRPPHAAACIPALEERRREQREHREGEHQRGDGVVEEREQREDDDRRDQGDEELRQVLAEVGLELLDAVHHRDQDRTGAFQPEVGGTERHHLGAEALAQLELDPRRGAVREHRARMFDPAAQHHDRRHERERHEQLGERIPGEYPREQPAEQRQPTDADQGREHPHRHRGGDPETDAVRELPETGVEEHEAGFGPVRRRRWLRRCGIRRSSRPCRRAGAGAATPATPCRLRRSRRGRTS